MTAIATNPTSLVPHLPKELWLLLLALLIAFIVFALIKALVRTVIIAVAFAALVLVANTVFPEQSAALRSAIKARLEAAFRDAVQKRVPTQVSGPQGPRGPAS